MVGSWRQFSWKNGEMKHGGYTLWARIQQLEVTAQLYIATWIDFMKQYHIKTAIILITIDSTYVVFTTCQLLFRDHNNPVMYWYYPQFKDEDIKVHNVTQ